MLDMDPPSVTRESLKILEKNKNKNKMINWIAFRKKKDGSKREKNFSFFFFCRC